MRILIKFFITVIIVFSTFSSYSKDLNLPENLIIYENLKEYDSVSFKNRFDKDINLKNYKGNLLLMNFWATWCEPCKKEMPSLDKLAIDPNFQNLTILPINIGQEKINKIEEFYIETNIENLDIFFDTDVRLAKKFLLRGVPTTVIMNKGGKEIARVVGSVDFQDEKFKTWLQKFD
tara:strand:+ start:2922 stop:3449 length:528 start_codon:yes stop_codon:yes gene_type:complete